MIVTISTITYHQSFTSRTVPKTRSQIPPSQLNVSQTSVPYFCHYLDRGSMWDFTPEVSAIQLGLKNLLPQTGQKSFWQVRQAEFCWKKSIELLPFLFVFESCFYFLFRKAIFPCTPALYVQVSLPQNSFKKKKTFIDPRVGKFVAPQQTNFDAWYKRNKK